MPLFAIAHVLHLRSGAFAVRSPDFPDCETQDAAMEPAREAFGVVLSRRVQEMVEAGTLPRLYSFQELEYSFSVRCSVELPAADRSPGTFDTVIAVRVKLPLAVEKRLAVMRGDPPAGATRRRPIRATAPGAAARDAARRAAKPSDPGPATTTIQSGLDPARSTADVPIATKVLPGISGVNGVAPDEPAVIRIAASDAEAPAHPIKITVSTAPAVPAPPDQPSPASAAESSSPPQPNGAAVHATASPEAAGESKVEHVPTPAGAAAPRAPAVRAADAPGQSKQPYTLQSALSDLHVGLGSKREPTPVELALRAKLAAATAERLAALRAARQAEPPTPAGRPDTIISASADGASAIPDKPTYTIRSAMAEIESGLKPRQSLPEQPAPVQPASPAPVATTREAEPERPATPPGPPPNGDLTDPASRLAMIAERLAGRTTVPGRGPRLGTLWRARPAAKEPDSQGR
jgi:hypothetical protein